MKKLHTIPLLLALTLPVLANDPAGDHHDVNGERHMLGVLDFQRRLLGMLTSDEEKAAYARGERPSLDGRMRPRTVEELSAEPERYPLWNAIHAKTKKEPKK